EFGSCITFLQIFFSEWYSLGTFYWSISLAALVELTIFILLIAGLGYFGSEQHAVDGYSVNWRRLGHFTASLALYYAYTQSLGHLVGVLLLEVGFELAVVVGTVLIPLVNIFDDFFFKTDELGSVAFSAASELLAIKH